ncbi:MAG TPA: lysophospholipid acyltransferase family protein [Acidobacteriaceae bacterium]|jgi:1-acyl-sn-glycerol-3-phosphate acyltransferase|nr:lysophospholipid acyltransferase family protein [Acidobacteriaceae bacterium]
MLATLRILFVYTALGPLAGLIGIPWTLLRGDITQLYNVSMWIMRAGIRAAGIRVEVTGFENIPAGRNCIFMCNHVSNLDPPILLPLIPGRISVLLKEELMRIPILGTAMRMGQFISVARTQDIVKAKATIEAAAGALRSGLHIVVFPEGSRSEDGRLLPFKKGPFYLAKETGAPVIPVAISGTEKMMPTGSFRIHPGTARIQMLPVIESESFKTREELMAAVRSAVNAALPPQMQNPQLDLV